jgi:hypothetical protein
MIKKKKKRSVKKKVHPAVAQANKTSLIAAISILTLVVLFLFLMSTDRLAGKAFFTSADGTLGIADPGTIEPSTAFTLTVQANIGTKETIAVGFDLTYPAELTCTGVTTLLGWTDGILVNNVTCASGVVHFEVGTLDFMNPKTGTFDVANISFAGASASTPALTFTNVEIHDLNNPDTVAVTTGLAPTLTIAAATSCTVDTECAAGEVCSASGVCVADLSCTADTECAAGEVCSASGVCVADLSCTVDTECAAGEVCSASGVCVADLSCTVDTECAAGEVCSAAGVCEAPPAVCSPLTVSNGVVAADCTITCNHGYSITADDTCEVLTITGTMAGVNVKVDELEPEEGVYITRVTFTGNESIPFQIFTTLFDENDTSTVFEIRTVGDMLENETLDVRTDALGKNITTKRVIIYDNYDPSEWTVHLNDAFEFKYE